MAENRSTCASCGTPNEEDARFCEGCGTALARVCATCGVEASATARFCRGCGTPLDGRVTAVLPDACPVRKTVSVMFADLAGSTAFEEKVDVETAREVIGRYHDLLRSIGQRHRAGVTKYIGDGFMAVWGVPEIRPDDAARAVEAAVELQANFVGLAAQVSETHGAELALRVAVNTGEVVVGAGDADLVGDALNVGARLEAECPRGGVVVGEETWRATRGRYGYESLGQIHVKGRTAPVAMYQWQDRRSESTDAAPFVGRSDEMRRLRTVFDDAVAARAARLVTVIGDPGVGKSRLAAEFTAALRDIRVVDARCVLEATVALAPIIEVLRAQDLETDFAATVPERDRLLRDLNGLVAGDAGSVEENFWALRRFIEVLAADQPLLLVLDDIQWADTLLLDFIEHLVEWAQGVPVLVLALARPELRESRPDLVTVSRWVSEAIHLGGLDAGATAELAAKVLGAARLPDDLLRRLPSSTGGNPLFVREFIGMLAHDGVLVEQPAGWRLTIDVDAIAIPPTIQALLASRLERLEASDRRLLEIASVIGSDFSLGAVQALADSGGAGIELSLKRLRRLELAQPSGAYVGDEPVWRFHHVLIRDVAYRRLLKSERADLHERLADWVEAGGTSVAFDPDEMIARHLEAAHTYRRELGTTDTHTGDLALRAARHYSAAARRALDRDELVSAGTQAARGAALAAADANLHADLLIIGCESFLSAGDVVAGASLVDDLDRIADAKLSPWATCYRCQFLVYTEPERLLDADARLQSAIDEFGRRKDHAGLAKAHRVRASARSRLGRIGDCEADLFEALIAARQSGDHRQITAALGAAPGAALWGPSPVPKAGGRCLDVVRMQRMTTAAPSLEATSLRHLAVLELLRGRPDKARKMLAEARQVVADLGLRHGLMETELFAGIIESMEGDPVAAEPHFRTALEGLEALGVGADAGQAAALLARAVLAQGRIDEADRHATESERLAGRNLKTAIAWRAVRAEILSAAGRHDEAAAMARESVAVAAATDLVLDHAEACLASERVLAAAGDINGASAARENAERLYSTKEAKTLIAAVPAPAASKPATDSADASSRRLVVSNRSSAATPAYLQALQAHDIDAALKFFSERFIYEDHRRLSGVPIEGLAATRQTLERISAQYTQFDFRVLAVRGEHAHLIWERRSDNDGNETTNLYVTETGDDDLVQFHARFDEDDFEDAYRELDRRYYGREGAAFADAASTTTEAIVALNNGEYDRLLNDLSTADLRTENRSQSGFPDRSVNDLRASFGELDTMITWSRTWLSVVHWISQRWSVNRLDREAIGKDGERYTWTRLLVIDVHDGRLASMCEFEPADEQAAFEYAEERVRETTSRLAVTNQADRTMRAFWAAMRRHDVDATLECCADGIAYDDRRSISGDLIRGRDALRRPVERIFEQYTDFEARTLAVRGEHLLLGSSRWSNDAGFLTSYLHVVQTGEHGQVVHETRFDADDFESAYRELERRYYTGEGAAYAENGHAATEVVTAINSGDFDRYFDEFTTPDIRVENRSRSGFPDRSVEDLRASFGELNAMVVSTRTWSSVVCWLSPQWSVIRLEREAVGHDGEMYAWTLVSVSEMRNGRMTFMCEFDLEDEDAFAYAEERLNAAPSRLAVTNRSWHVVRAVIEALIADDVGAAVSCYSDQFAYGDHRRLTGGPVRGRAQLTVAFERILQQYSRSEWKVLAVRGNTLTLDWSKWSDDYGNETSYLHVFEIDEDDLIVYEGRFDEDDFDGAYRELERRYYAGEGAAFAEGGATSTETFTALSCGDYDRVFGDLVTPDMRIENRSRSAFPDRSASDLRTSWGALDTMISSQRTWPSAMCWLSPSWSVSRVEREAVGHDDERYVWTFVLAAQIVDGRVALLCQFDLDDEQAAFAYAEERMRATASRLALTNQSCGVAHAWTRAMEAHDVDGTLRHFSDGFVYDDRRRVSGDPIVGLGAMRRAIERVFEQYTRFDNRILAVRGDNLDLYRSRWADDDGNETTSLFVDETGDDGRIIYHARFDEDDFESAYRELERRYYADEGVDFAESGTTMTEWTMALNRFDFDRVFDELTASDLRVENRSRSAFPDRSASQYRATLEELAAMVVSARSWITAVRWVSQTCGVSRCQRDAIGRDGEHYSWLFLIVTEVHGGRVTSTCEFDPDDEEAAFAYAEQRILATASRLAITNRAGIVVESSFTALQAGDATGMVANFADSFVYDDRRRLRGNPINDVPTYRAAVERALTQYNRFEWRILAVRGRRLVLMATRISNDDGFESAYLHLIEIDDDGHIVYEGRFDEDDFEDAYRGLEGRYYSGEGAAYAEAGAAATEYTVAANQGDLDRLVGELSSSGMRVENRSRSGFPDRSVDQFRNSLDDLNDMVHSARTWSSAICWLSSTWSVARQEREAVGRSGEHFAWTRLIASEVVNGRVTSICMFEPEDEEAAFAYAEERAQESASRLVVVNRASRMADTISAALNAADADGVAACFSQDFVYDDRRRLSGDPIRGGAQLRLACERILAQYNRFDDYILAVRGEHLVLGFSRWSNDSGYETTQIAVNEIGDDGKINFQVRFDDDDFEGAYRELTRRYCAGEGARFAEGVTVGAEWLMTLNAGDFDRLFGQLTDPEMRVENRSSSAFPSRSAVELRSSLEELYAMVTGVRSWNSVERWLDSECAVIRHEREAVGADGERYAWTRLYVFEADDGRCTGLCEFEVDDEAAAFAYAEEQVRRAQQR